LDENPWMPGRYCGRQLWDETFAGKDPRLTSINLGISGDRTEHVLQRLLPRGQGGGGELDAPELQPDAVVLLVGINNSWAAESPVADSVYAGIVAVIDAVHARKPKARIILQTLLPTNEAGRNHDVVEPVNARLAELSQDPTRRYIEFVDLHHDFIDEHGEQIGRYFNDGLHPSLEGYRVWRDRLVATLSRP
jgi:lysophospholipase L1-like esterase